MKPFKYSSSEVAKINQIFAKNNVKLTFDKFSDYYKSLEELIAQISKCSIRHHLENYYYAVSHEYDVKKFKYLTETKYYLYSTVIFQTTKKVNMHLNALREAFYYFQSGLFDIDASYGIATKVEYNTTEGFYYKLTNGNLPVLTDEFFDHMMRSFNIDDVNLLLLKNLRATTELLEFNYICIDYSDKVTKLGFATPIFNFIESDIKKFYGSYVMIENFCRCLESVDKNMGIGVQLSTSNTSFLGLELKIPHDSLNDYLILFGNNELLSQEQVEYIINIVGVEEATEHTIKFRWSDENKYTIKWYNEFPNEVGTPEWYENI